QALWIRLLRQLGRISEPADQKKWNDLAARALASVETLFWMEDKGWYADVLLSAKGTSTRQAMRGGGIAVSGGAGCVAVTGAIADQSSAAGLCERRRVVE